jgi:lipoprotein-anchoring transpeptidase ErfK/SrfK
MRTNQPQTARQRKNLIYAVFLGLLLIVLLGGILLTRSVTPVSALFGLIPGTAAGTQTPAFALVAETHPSETPAFPPTSTITFPPTQPVLPSLTATVFLTATASQTPAPSATWLPSETPTEALSPTPLPTDTPEPTLEPSPTLLPVVEAPAPGPNPGSTSSTTATGGVHWIEVDLTNQRVYAYEGQTLVNSFIVSTGAAPRLTVTGSYHVYERHVSGNMWGPGYFLPDVPYIMYFYKGYALHGTYWHNNFGTPMSHGCVNLATPDAEWLYYWSSMGTLVKVHY